MRATRHCQTVASRHEGTGLFIVFESIDDVFCTGSLRDVMFRETSGAVVEKSAEIRCLQERTLEKPAVYSHRQQVFWGSECVGIMLGGLQTDFPFLTAILQVLRYFSFQVFRNMAK